MTYTKSKTKKAQAKNQKTVPRYIMFKVQKTKEEKFLKEAGEYMGG